MCSVLTLTPPVGYERAWRQLPARHQALVRSIQIDRTSSGQAREKDMSVHLTPWNQDSGDGQLWHEVAHIVLYAHPRLETLWNRQFWPEGVALGQLVSSRAAHSPEEDFAESYKEFIERGEVSDSERNSFLYNYVFIPAAYSVGPRGRTGDNKLQADDQLPEE
jgi:hypothetical protein